ncbi:MAG: hypothetical protein IJY50_08825 [Clostridia bacterium]|nr:hypothetical protein [Clostridia bacterium]
MQHIYWGWLHLFGEADGCEDLSELTPQTSGESNTSAPAAEETADQQPEARRQRFRAMMDGEYKDLFTAYFQETFNRRFREQKDIKEELERARSLIENVAGILGVRPEELPQAVQRCADRTFDSADLEQAVRETTARVRAETEAALLAQIRARGLRPAESALHATGESPGLGTVQALSREQRADMARRAAKGERIWF